MKTAYEVYSEIIALYMNSKQLLLIKKCINNTVCQFGS